MYFLNAFYVMSDAYYCLCQSVLRFFFFYASPESVNHLVDVSDVQLFSNRVNLIFSTGPYRTVGARSEGEDVKILKSTYRFERDVL